MKCAPFDQIPSQSVHGSRKGTICVGEWNQRRIIKGEDDGERSVRVHHLHASGLCMLVLRQCQQLKQAPVISRSLSIKRFPFIPCSLSSCFLHSLFLIFLLPSLRSVIQTDRHIFSSFSLSLIHTHAHSLIVKRQARAILRLFLCFFLLILVLLLSLMTKRMMMTMTETKKKRMMMMMMMMMPVLRSKGKKQ